MDHQKYHAVRRSAESSAFDRADFTALAAIAEAGDKLYRSQDWTDFSDEDWLVYGILTGYRLTEPAEFDITQTPAWEVCRKIVKANRLVEIACMVFEKVET